MLSNDYFYFQLIRKYIAAFGSVFNNIIIQRTNEITKEVTQIINVPISYAEKEKMLTRVLADPNIGRKDSTILPRMSFFMDGMTYAPDRKGSSNQKYIIAQPGGTIGWQFSEVPYDFHFTLWIWVKNNEDATKLLEQICPFFTPDYTVRVKLIPHRQSVDVPIVLKSISHADTQSEDFKNRDMLVWELHFTLKANLYGPIHQAPVIDFSTINFYEGEAPDFAIVNNMAYGLSGNIVNVPNEVIVPDDIVVIYNQANN